MAARKFRLAAWSALKRFWMMVGFKLRDSHRMKKARPIASFQRAVLRRRAESIALASSRKLIVILDDRAARSFAVVMGITFLGTAGMLFQAFFEPNFLAKNRGQPHREFCLVMLLQDRGQTVDAVGSFCRERATAVPSVTPGTVVFPLGGTSQNRLGLR